MRLSEPRVKPLSLNEMDEEQREVVKRAAFDEPLNIHLTLARHAKLLKRWLVFAAHILNKSSFPAREREIAILRIGHLCKAGYEWAQHVDIGKQVGLTDKEIEMIKRGPDAEGWSAKDRTILCATDELHSDAFITDKTWNELKKTYNDNQIMDLIFAVGNYNLVSMALNSLGVQLEK
jgi:alkylhydroperoxidase family enzyme